MVYKLVLINLLMIVAVFAKETVLFIDTNNNDREIEEAERAAKIAGKKFLSYPKKGEPFSHPEAKALLENTSFSTLILSGHNGGGHISGDNGSIGIDEVYNTLKKTPGKIKNLNTLLLLGCNTGNQSQMTKWKSRFPNLDIIAGYDGTAPAQDKPAGLSYIREIITKGDDLIAIGDEKKLERELRKLEHIYFLEAGFYIRSYTCPPEGSDVMTASTKEYLFRPLIENTKNRFKAFNLSECVEVVGKYLSEVQPVYTDYYNGNKSVTLPENKEEIRKLYNFYHQNKHCLESGVVGPDGEEIYPPHWKQVLFLRFWEDTRENILKFYHDQLTHYFSKTEELRNLSVEDIKKRLSYKRTMIKVKIENLKILMENGYDTYIKKLSSLQSKYEKEKSPFLAQFKFFKKLLVDFPNFLSTLL